MHGRYDRLKMLQEICNFCVVGGRPTYLRGLCGTTVAQLQHFIGRFIELLPLRMNRIVENTELGVPSQGALSM